jgi:hypothetical protein
VRLVSDAGLHDLVQRVHKTMQRHSSVAELSLPKT